MMHADRPASRKLSGHFDWRLTAISTGPARAGSVTWHNFRDHKYSEPLGHTVTVDGNSWLSKSSLKQHACLKAGYAACIATYSVVLRVGTLGRSDALAPCVLDVFEIHSWCRVLTPGAARKTARTNCVCAALRGRPPCAPKWGCKNAPDFWEGLPVIARGVCATPATRQLLEEGRGLMHLHLGPT